MRMSMGVGLYESSVCSSAGGAEDEKEVEAFPRSGLEGDGSCGPTPRPRRR